eukprot:TRINITY_DN22235_c0_g1_i1.p1 TRINITY_DN22235_c0_g1~~TRINITY_DN22235_c0_g1_i1.p1  ORF type:complete len:706 (-),score=226.96 TRINITY_DN22235_c0_g1_i1:186-2303(-)
MALRLASAAVLWLSCGCTFARGQYDAKQLEAAAEKYKKAIEDNPESAAAHSNLASILKLQGETQSAEDEYRLAMKLNPALPDIHFLLGELLVHKRSWSEAERMLKKSLKLAKKVDDPAHGQTHLYLGIISGDKNKAEGHYNKAIKLDPTQTVAHYNLAVLQTEQGDLTGAEKSYLSALELDPQHHQSASSLAGIYQRKREWKTAEKYYALAVKMDPLKGSKYATLAQIQAGLGKLDEAKENYEKGIELEPFRTESFTNLGLLQEAMGDLSGAEESYRNALALNPFDVATHANLGATLKAQGDSIGAQKAYREAISLNPTVPHPHNNLGLELQDQGDLAAAEESFEKAIKADPTEATAYRNLGKLLKKRGDLDGAADQFRAAIRERPTAIEAYSDLGLVLAQNGDMDEAKDVFKSRVKAASRANLWPLRVAVTEVSSNDEAFEWFENEAANAKSFVNNVKEATDSINAAKKHLHALVKLAGKHSRVDELPKVVRNYRTFENMTNWMSRQWEEVISLGDEGLKEGLPPYGIIFLQSWLRVFEHKSFMKGGLQSKWKKDQELTIAGSGLGYQCAFSALALGLPCTGYDSLCKSLVKDATVVADQNGLNAQVEPAVKFICDDITTSEFDKTGILWLEDRAWEEDERRRILTAAVPSLPPGAHIVSYKKWPGDAKAAGVKFEGDVIAQTSWNDYQKIHIFRKPASGREEL